MEDRFMAHLINRRDFLGMAGGAAAGMVFPHVAWGQDSDRKLRLGIIGVGSRGTGLMSIMLAHGDASFLAVADISSDAARRAAAIVDKASGKKPELYTQGPDDYLRMLKRDDLDAVMVCTPIPLHARMSVDAMKAGKHVFSEVPAAVTLDECWDLVRTAEKTGKTYMLAENCCYYRDVLMVLNMVEQGVFGELTYAECGYIHDCRFIGFDDKGNLTWRGELYQNTSGNWYPTHAIGPVARWIGINRTDRFECLTAMSSRPVGAAIYAEKKFGKDHPASKIKFRSGDTTNALIRTTKGVLVEIRFDVSSLRPHPSTTNYLLQGTKAVYLDDGRRIYIEGKTAKYEWESVAPYEKPYEHPLWQKWGQAASTAGHGGADFFTTRLFLDVLRTGAKSPVDVYDAAAWSAIVPLTCASVAAGGKPQEFPDFMVNAKRA